MSIDLQPKELALGWTKGEANGSSHYPTTVHDHRPIMLTEAAAVTMST